MREGAYLLDARLVSKAKGGQRARRGDRRWRRASARSRGERLTLLSLGAGLQLDAHEVQVGAVAVDEAAAKSGDVGEVAGAGPSKKKA